VWEFGLWNRNSLSKQAGKNEEKLKEMTHLLTEIKVVNDQDAHESVSNMTVKVTYLYSFYLNREIQIL